MTIETAVPLNEEAALIDGGAAVEGERTSYWLRLVRRPTAIFGIFWLFLLIFCGLFAGVIAPENPLAQNLVNGFQTPNAANWLGTDQLGRDVLSRLIYGAGISIFSTVEAVAIAILVGVPLGLCAGYKGGAADSAISRFADVLLSIPLIIVLLSVSGILGNNLALLMAVLGLFLSSSFIRLTRSATQDIKGHLYVDASKLFGYSSRRILTNHVLPAIIPPVIVQGTLLLGVGLLIESGLAFLGVGTAPPAPSWGGMVADATESLTIHPWLMVPPGIVIILTVLACNFLGDALIDTRDIGGRRASGKGWKRTRGVEQAILRADVGRIDPQPQNILKLAHGVIGQGAPLLEVEHLSVGFLNAKAKTVNVTTDVSFCVNAGETVALVGESGCGKTVTARALLGLLAEGGAAQQGRVTFKGIDVLSLDEGGWSKIRGRQIAFVSQEPMVALDPCFRVGSVLREAVRRHSDGAVGRRQASDRALELLRLVRIKDPERVARQYPHQLSGGMAQRVAIALALAGKPDLIVADEPTTALDVTVQAEILDLLRDLQAGIGMAVLLVTHELGIVADFCSKAIVMYAGQIVESGPVTTVLHAPAHPYTARLLAANPRGALDREKLPTIEGNVPAPGAWPTACRFMDRCDRAEMSCAAGAIPLMRLAPEHDSRCLFAERLVTENMREHLTQR